MKSMSPHVKYDIIQNALALDNNLLSIEHMCELAEVSRSGFYRWKNTADKREEREQKDRQDFELILAAYNFRGYAKGVRGIHMRLLHMGIRMNVKKIRRLMRKYGLKCQIRKANPYRRIAKSMKTSTVAPNVVKREFRKGGPRGVLLTDITYLFYSGKVCYLSTILDAYTHEILTYKLSSSLEVTFVLATVDELIDRYDCELDDTTILHSDQGCHYTSKAFIAKLRDNRFVQSMSRKGNCWDNAPQESFFGHMKDDVKDIIAECTSFDEVMKVIDDWMDYYNHDRYQWELCKLSPCEYHEYAVTGIYLLPTWGSAPDPEV